MPIKKIRFFGRKDCVDCIKAYILISRYQVECEYVDADSDDDEIQNICDIHEVFDLPHLQFLNESGHVVIEHIGPIEEIPFVTYLNEEG